MNMVLFARNHMLVEKKKRWTLSQNGNSKALTRASDCTTLPHWHGDSSEVSKSSTENPSYWQMWPAKKIWQAAIGEDVPNVLGGPQKKSCWTAANEESVKLKLLFGRTLSLSSKGSLIRLNGRKSMFGGVARGWQVEWGSVWGCI